MKTPEKKDGVLVGLAAVAAFVAGLLAVSQHAECTAAGYRLAVAQREHLELSRAVDQIERRVDALRTPQAATARAATMKLASLKYPKTWNVVNATTIERRAAIAFVSPLPTVQTLAVSSKGAAR